MKRLALSQAGGQALLLAATPLLTRTYEPSDIGHFQVSFALAILLASILTLRIEAFIPAAPLRDQRKLALRYAALGLSASSGTALLALAIGCLFPAASSMTLLIFAVFGMAAAFGFASVENALLIGMQETDRLATRNLLSGAIAAGLQVAGGLFFPSVAWLATSIILGRVMAVTLTLAWRGTRLERGSAELEARPPRLGSLIGAVGASIMGNLNPQIALLGASSGYGPSAAGQYALSARSSTAPASLLGAGLSQHYAMLVSADLRMRGGHVWAITRRQFARLLPLGALCAATIAAVGLTGFGLIFGTEWTEAGVIAAILSPCVLTQIAASPLTAVFPLVGRQALHLRVELSKGVVMVIVVGASIVGGLTLASMAAVVSASTIAGHALTFAAVRSAARSWDSEIRRDTSSE